MLPLFWIKSPRGQQANFNRALAERPRRSGMGQEPAAETPFGLRHFPNQPGCQPAAVSLAANFGACMSRSTPCCVGGATCPVPAGDSDCILFK